MSRSFCSDLRVVAQDVVDLLRFDGFWDGPVPAHLREYVAGLSETKLRVFERATNTRTWSTFSCARVP